MTVNICEQLSANGFPVQSFYEDEMCFGNIVIKSKLHCGIPLSMINDRGIWDCNVISKMILRKEEVPLVAIIYLLEGTPFHFEELTFNSDEELIKWLVTQKEKLTSLTKEQIREAKKKWDILIKERMRK